MDQMAKDRFAKTIAFEKSVEAAIAAAGRDSPRAARIQG